MRFCDNTQKAKIHIAAQALGLITKQGDERYRDVLWMQFKAKSCTELSYAQAEKLYGHLKQLGYKPKYPRRKRTKPRPEDSNVIWLTTTNQKLKIQELEECLGWHTNPDRLSGFIAKRITRGKPKKIHLLTKKEASRLIETLKAILAGGRGERHEKADKL